jgi:hypothetical protein
MSTKHLTATLATALAFSALTATAAQALPVGIDVHKSTGQVAKVTNITTHKSVRTGTYTPVSPSQIAGARAKQPIRTGSYTPVAPAKPVQQAAAKAGDGTSITLMVELAGLVLLGVALIAIWASVRSGRRFRPLPY